MNNDFKFVILCSAFRPETGSWIKIKVPEEHDTPNKAALWVSKELNEQFIPMQFDVVTEEVADDELRVL